MATILGSVASVIVGVLMLRSGKYHIIPSLRRPEHAEMKEVIGIGGPKTLEEFMGGLAIMLTNLVIMNNIGADALAVHGVTFAMIYLFTIISDSVGTATQPVCSVAAGAHRTESMKSSIMFSAILLAAVTIFIAVLLELFTGGFVDSMIDGDSVKIRDSIIYALKFYAVLMPFYLMTRFVSTVMQIVRKAYIWTPTILFLQILELILSFFLISDLDSMLMMKTVCAMVVGTIGCIMAYFYVRDYDPDTIDEMLDKGKATTFRMRSQKKDTSGS